jgi:hypothetical protein
MACRLRPRTEGWMRNQVKGSRHKTDYFNRLEWLCKCCMRISDRIELSGVSMIFGGAEALLSCVTF